MSTPLTCAQANDLLARNDSLFGAWITEAYRESNIWNTAGFIPSLPFPTGTGYTHRTISIEGITAASDESDWAAVTPSAGGVINPLSKPTITTLAWGQNYMNWSPFYKSYKTPCIALDDLRFDHDVTAQLAATVNQLGEVTNEWTANRKRYEAARLMPQISARPGFGPNGIAGVTDTTVAVNKAGVVIPTAYLHQSLLNTAYDYLLTNGAGKESSRASIEDGAPVLTLVTSRGTSDNIIAASGIRDDFRYGDPGALLKPLGIRRVYKGFAHVTDTELPRFDLVAGQLVRRMPWKMTAGDSGSVRVPGDNWSSAGYELNYILPRDVYNQRVIMPFEREIAGAKFQDYPEYYNAMFKWMNIQDNDSNPLGKIGFWLGISANSSEPLYPKRGLTVLTKRCPNDVTFPACVCGA